MLKIWKKSESLKADKDAVFLRLIQDGNDVDLCLVNTEGKKIESGNVLSLDGDLDVLILHAQVNQVLKMKRDVANALISYPSWQLQGIEKSIT